MTERKQDLLECILECFVQNGLQAVSMREAAKACGVEAAALYYYFINKKDMVTQCAELAIRELSEKMEMKTVSLLADYTHLAEHLMQEAQEYMPLMRFIVSVRVSPEYGDTITKSVQAFSRRYETYVQRAANRLDCHVERIRPIVYMMIVSIVNYLIFGEASLFLQQFAPIQQELGVIVSGGSER